MSYAKDEKLLMHFFQETLTGAAITWYTNLGPSRVHSWKDLMCMCGTSDVSDSEVRTCTFEKKPHLTRSSWKMPKDDCDSEVHLMLVSHQTPLGFLSNS